MAKTVKKTTKKEFNVTLARIGQEATVHRLTVGSTVGDLLTKAGYNGDATDVRVDARPTARETKLAANQVVTIVPKVQGG